MIRSILLALVAAHLASPMLPVHAAAQKVFSAEASLVRSDIVQGPVINASGTAVAWITGNPGDNTQIKTHKPAGIFHISTRDKTASFSQIARAYDPVWSPDGKKLAVFSEFGPNRQLIVINVAEKGTPPVTANIAGEYARKSARHFKPVWLADNRSLVIAQAQFHETAMPEDRPYSQTSDTRTPVFDAHFRDDTLWALHQIDTITGKSEALTPAIPLRHMVLSPDGHELLIGQDDPTLDGMFMGDTYVRPHIYKLLSVGTGEIKPLSLANIANPVWDGRDKILFSQAGAVNVYDIATARTETIIDDAKQPAENFLPSPDYIALWHKAPQSDQKDYLNAPPTAAQLSIFDRNSGLSHAVIRASDDLELLHVTWTRDYNRLILHTRSISTLIEKVMSYDAQTNTTKTLFEGDVALHSIDVAQTRLVFRTENATGRIHVVSLDLKSGKQTSLVRVDLASEYPGLVRPRMITFKTTQGKRRNAILYLPPDHKPGDATTLVATAYGQQTDKLNSFQAEAQMHVAKGYAYLMPDVFLYRNRLDTAYLETVPAAIRAARTEFGLNGKVGFYGGSLGGFAGLVLISKSQTIDAAALRAAPSEFSLSWATGKDRDADLLEYLMAGKTPFDDKQSYDENSPFWFSTHITAPLLLLHGDNDMQVPVDQGIWMYQALRRLGKEAELRIYPGADHSITRANRNYYLDYYESIFRWWQTRLAPAEYKQGPNK